MIDYNGLLSALRASLPEERLAGLGNYLKDIDYEEDSFFKLFGAIVTIDEFLKITNELNFDSKDFPFDKERAIRKLLYEIGWIDPLSPSDGPDRIRKDFKDLKDRFYESGSDLKELRCIAQALSLIPERLLKNTVTFWIQFYIDAFGFDEAGLSNVVNKNLYKKVKQDKAELGVIIDVLKQLNSNFPEDKQEDFIRLTGKTTLLNSSVELFGFLDSLKNKRNDIAHSKRSGFAKGDANFLRDFIDEMVNDFEEALRICDSDKLLPSIVRISRLIIDKRGLKVECYNEVGEMSLK